MNIIHPTKIVIPVSQALREWTGPVGLVQEKKDGCFTVVQVKDFFVTCEKMRDGGLWAFDFVQHAGQDCRNLPLKTRWLMLNGRVNTLADAGIKIVPSVPSERGAAFLASILATPGGEGAVLKAWDSTYHQAMLAAKRAIIVQCRVTGIGPGQSIALADSAGDIGRCPAKGGVCDRLRVGSVVRVEAACFTEGRKLREPKLCSSYLVQY